MPRLDEVRRPTEHERVEDWREEALVRAGYPVDDAITLSRLPDVDLHSACQLLAHGCPVQTALQILT